MAKMDNPTHEVFFFFWGGPCGPRTPFFCQAFLTMSKVEAILQHNIFFVSKAPSFKSMDGWPAGQPSCIIIGPACIINFWISELEYRKLEHPRPSHCTILLFWVAIFFIKHVLKWCASKRSVASNQLGCMKEPFLGRGGERREEKGRGGNKRLWQNFLWSLELNIAQV